MYENFPHGGLPSLSHAWAPFQTKVIWYIISQNLYSAPKEINSEVTIIHLHLSYEYKKYPRLFPSKAVFFFKRKCLVLIINQCPLRENVQLFWIRAILSPENKECLRLSESVLIFKKTRLRNLFWGLQFCISLSMSPVGNRGFAVFISELNS